MDKKPPIVIKIGGSTFKSGDTTIEDLATLQNAGHSLVVVHGGGDAINGWLQRLDIKSPFHGGYRVTDQNTLVVVVAVLAGIVNKTLVAAINGSGGKAFGFSGADGSLVQARIKDDPLGLVGEVDRVDPGVIRMVLEAGFMPVIAPIGWKPRTQTDRETLLNLNGDTMTGAVAAALEAGRVVFLTDVDGILNENKELIPNLPANKARELITSGTITSGMIPKVEACLAAVKKAGIIRIINGNVPHALLNEIEGKARGTTVVD